MDKRQPIILTEREVDKLGASSALAQCSIYRPWGHGALDIYQDGRRLGPIVRSDSLARDMWAEAELATP